MEFSYKCPVCRAGNTLTPTSLTCRRCKSDLTPIYEIKKRGFFKVLKTIATRKATPRK